ncbi:50S ribosomal protein L22 [Acidobacteria bacterium AH-259-A15]|nr:50S ribosomal protein L22 [Acidobacteria bacterium AH-259-A15]
MEAQATAKYIKGSSQKARLVIDLIRGKKVEQALSILEYSRKRAARPIEKVLRSAIANAEQKSPTVSLEELVVKEAFVNSGPTKWRWRIRAAPMGRAHRERRRQSHITIRISDEQDEEM